MPKKNMRRTMTPKKGGGIVLVIRRCKDSETWGALKIFTHTQSYNDNNDDVDSEVIEGHLCCRLSLMAHKIWKRVSSSASKCVCVLLCISSKMCGLVYPLDRRVPPCGRHCSLSLFNVEYIRPVA